MSMVDFKPTVNLVPGMAIWSWEQIIEAYDIDLRRDLVAKIDGVQTDYAVFNVVPLSGPDQVCHVVIAMQKDLTARKRCIKEFRSEDVSTSRKKALTFAVARATDEVKAHYDV